MTTFMIATIISLCVNQIETQRLYMAQYFGKTDNEIEPIIYVLIMMVILLIIAGFLLIYNVMSVSVSRDIRFYGQLRTIGMSQKQIKRMVLQQILLLCAIGIPLGLISSALISLAAVPIFLNMSSQISAAGHSISFHPLIFIGAALLALIPVIIGGFNPARKAAQVSPVEALRFSEYGYVRKQVRTSISELDSFYAEMAWRNVFRVPKRASLVFCVLNFINVITASILARRHELALLESVGQSGEQSKKTLIYEGHSFFIMVFVICLSIPRLVYHFVSRETIIDRLKEAE